MKDWEQLSAELGPLPAAYHPAPYTFPRPLTPEQMPRFPDAELESAAGFTRLYPPDYGREEWRMKRYVGEG